MANSMIDDLHGKSCVPRSSMKPSIQLFNKYQAYLIDIFDTR